MRSLTLVFLALAPVGVLSQRVSKDATCGGSTGNTCNGSAFGNCCSQYGWCGSTDAYCGEGCKASFGKCTQGTASGPVSSSAKTSSGSRSPSAAPGSPSSLPLSIDARCGLSFGGKTCLGSSWGDCCSQYNWCGSTKDHCAANTCQKGYGKCNTVSSSKGSAASSAASSASKASSTSPSALASSSAVQSSLASQSSLSSLAIASTGTISSSLVNVLASTVSPSSPVVISSSSSLVNSILSSSASSPSAVVISASSSLVGTISSSTASPLSSNPIASIKASDVPSSSYISSDSIASQSTSIGPSSSINNDSPPFTPTASVVLPTDPEQFLATYTFQDDALPTPVAMGSPPIMEGISTLDEKPVKTCLIIPGKADATFELLDSKDRIPLIRRTDGTLGGVKAPKSEAEFLAMGPIEDIKFTSFALESTSNGLFDLVTKDSSRQYVAKKSDGSVILTDKSTNDAQLSTSIFDITCEGRLTVRIGSQHYTWALRDDDSVMQTAEGTPDTVYTLPDSPAAAKLRRRNKSQDGIAPRCPSSPRPLDAGGFDGRRGNNPNGCGSAERNVPDLSFGSCCDQHDNDFDDCGLSFQEANDRFHSCMRGRGCDGVNHWYTFQYWVACLKTADFYYSVVSGYFGLKAFDEANRARCKCYCSGSTPHGCMVNGQFSCLNVQGTDTNNCGACGRVCPQGSRCENGQCKCPADQCGNRCVTLSSHPKNCGSCGRVSPSGYCVQGQFYTPPAFCSRGNGFRNGNFANGGNYWTSQIVSGGSNSRFDVGFDGGAQDSDAMVGIFSLYSPNGGANLKTSVKMCPGTAYNLGFQIRRPYGTDSCSYYVYLAGELKNSGSVPQPTNVGAGWMWVSGLRAGPFNGERQGVSAAGPELWAEFQLDIRCSGGAPYNFIRVDQFSINPA